MSFLNLSARTFLLVAFFGVSLVHAQVVRVPDGLERGDQYRLLFLSSAKRTAESSDASDYDEFVQSLADAAPEVGSWGYQWQAVVSSADTDARDRINVNHEVEVGVPIYRIDGLIIAEDYSKFWPDTDGDINFIPPLNVSELGDMLVTTNPRDDSVEVFTATRASGIRDVKGMLGGSPVGYGTPETGSREAIWRGQWPAVELNHIYAISEVVTVPEPSHSSFYFVAVSALLWATGRSKRRHNTMPCCKSYTEVHNENLLHSSSSTIARWELPSN